MAIPSKGAIITGTTANNTTTLGVGTNGQVLAADSTASSGLIWQTGAQPEWVDAGSASQFVTATTTAPTFGTDGIDKCLYRQLGPTTWEVYYRISYGSSSGASDGSGSYLWELPNSLQFDTSFPGQEIHTDAATDSTKWWGYTFPCFACNQRESTGKQSTYTAPIVYSSTQFRIFANSNASGVENVIYSGWYEAGQANMSYMMRFTFEAA